MLMGHVDIQRYRSILLGYDLEDTYHRVGQSVSTAHMS